MCQPKAEKKALSALFAGLFLLFFSVFPALGQTERARKTLMVFGDSLVAGYGLPAEQGFTGQLQDRLIEQGIDIKIVNAGVSGDTTAGGLARLEWALSQPPDYFLLILGGNDLLRGLNPAQSRENLDAILGRLNALEIKTMLCGMLAPVNLGAEYGQNFNQIYPDLAVKYDLAFYPFFLQDVALNPYLNQRDGIHPNAAGVAKIIEGMMPVLRPFLIEEVK